MYPEARVSFCLQVVSRAQITSAMIKILSWISLYFSPLIRSFITCLLLTREALRLGQIAEFSITSKTADLVTTGPASQGSELSSCFNSGRAVQAHFLGFFIDQTHLFLVLSLYVFMDLFLGIPVVQRPLTCPCQVHPTKMGTHGCRSLLYFSLLMERHGEIL